MGDWDHERAQDEDPVADEEPYEFDIHGTTVETGYHYDYVLLASVLLKPCAGDTEPADRQCCGPSVLLRPCAGDTEPADRQCWWLLARASDTPSQLAFYRCWSPGLVPLRRPPPPPRRGCPEPAAQPGSMTCSPSTSAIRRATSTSSLRSVSGCPSTSSALRAR